VTEVSDKDLIGAVGAFLLPLLIALAQRPTWSDRRRAVVGFAIVFAWTLLVFFFVGGDAPLATDWRAWLRLALVNFVTAIASYQGLWKQIGWAQRVEGATSPPSGARSTLMREADRKERPPRTPAD
jgi:apolipoprotein N-acyltransferase